MDELVLALSDPGAADADRFGPKGANQAALGHAGLPIPGGFVVDAEAYRLQLEHLGLTGTARLAATLERVEARHHISKVRLGLFEGAIAPAVLEPLIGVWRQLEASSGTLTVVRSSALMEDRAGSNFAGQFESFLGLAKRQ